MPKKTLLQRCKTTLAGQKARAKKYGETIPYTADDLCSIVPERCKWCDRKLTPAVINFDHMVPLARGGKWELDNLCAICGPCNRKKGALSDHEYKYLLLLLDHMTKKFESDYATKNILARMAAGGAFIYG